MRTAFLHSGEARQGLPLGGVGAQPPPVRIRGAASSALACLRTKLPKNEAIKNETNERTKMKQTKIFYATNGFIKRLTPPLILLTMTSQVLLAGCASVNHREDSIESILKKENALIEKLRFERAQPDVSEAVLKSDSLKKAEAHLSTSLDELFRANEVIMSKILKQSNQEEMSGTIQRRDD